MEIIIANNSGFCFGVERAIKTTYTTLEESPNDKTYSYGPLIHNPQMVQLLEKKGLQTITEYSKLDKGNIIIRSHGISKDVEEDISQTDLTIVDTTCPYVKAIHKRVEKYYNEGYNIVIIGDALHAEVIGINGYSNNTSYIINSTDEAEALPQLEKLCIVSQTTNTLEKFNEIVGIIRSKAEEVQIFNTICKATKDRQDSAAEVAKQVEAMIVIGGKNSSNTNKLVEISKMYCENVFHIEKIDDLSLQKLLRFNTIGITAGASTPDWIIKEAVKAMDNLNNNEELMEAIESSFTRIRRGEVVKGQVIFVTNNEVMVNINYKSDGIINREELSKDPVANPKDLFKEGDEIFVYVLNMDDGEGNVVLSSKRVEDMKKWDILEEQFNNKEIIEATVLNVVKGGLIAEVNDVDGFIPASHASANYVSNLEQFKGKTFNVSIIDFDKEKRRIILSRKEIEKVELDKMREEVWAKLEINKTLEGVVQRLTDFGAFVDLGGVDGLIHISDLSWNRVRHPSEVVNPGDKVEVRVLDLDQERNRISLGLKQTTEEPWSNFQNNTKIGDIVQGKIVNILDFGAFVRLQDGVDGLLHVSQISHDHVDKPSNVLNLGDEITVKIIDINIENKRISLSVKDLNPKEEKKDKKEEEYVLENDDEEVTIGDILGSK